MKGLILFLLSAILVALMLSRVTRVQITSLFPGSELGSIFTHYRDDVAAISSSRKLKEMILPSTVSKRGERSGNLDDYLPIDPTPSSKAYIRPGPIEHDTPLMPFIPKSPPPHEPSNHGLIP